MRLKRSRRDERAIPEGRRAIQCGGVNRVTGRATTVSPTWIVAVFAVSGAARAASSSGVWTFSRSVIRVIQYHVHPSRLEGREVNTGVPRPPPVKTVQRSGC